jgi:hypothetical protein
MLRTVLIAAVAALTLVGVASGGSTASKQRVAIDGTFHAGSNSGTFKVISLTAGALKKDAGKFTGTGNFGNPFVRKNGQEVTTIGGLDSYVGANGTLNVAQRIEQVGAGRNYTIATGTWSVVSGTGAYEGYRGGGSFAAAGTPSGTTIFFRQEGYLTKG